MTQVVTERQALLAAVLARPDDDSVRLIYADKLEDDGEPERAEFIRLMIEGERMQGGWHGIRKARRDMGQRLRELHRESLPDGHRLVNCTFKNRLPYVRTESFGPVVYTWRRGFIERIDCPGTRYVFQWWKCVTCWSRFIRASGACDACGARAIPDPVRQAWAEYPLKWVTISGRMSLPSRLFPSLRLSSQWRKAREGYTIDNEPDTLPATLFDLLVGGEKLSHQDGWDGRFYSLSGQAEADLAQACCRFIRSCTRE